MSLSAQHLQANRLDLLSRLAGDISHEIKNPLHAMVINLELVRRRIEKGESSTALERVGIVEDEIRKVHALANALLEALRPPRDTQQTSTLASVLSELMPLVSARARLARVEPDLQLGEATLLVPLAAHELRLLLLNLADRAVRCAGDGGGFALRAGGSGRDASLEITCARALLDDAERAWLRDAPADVDHIDLGLRVVRHLVERAGGRIETSASGDSGSAIRVSLPRADAA